MPYQSNSELPDSVRNPLPVAAQTRFRQVVNSALDRGLSEERAFASAWTAVKNGWKKPDAQSRRGKWVRKDAKTFDEIFEQQNRSDEGGDNNVAGAQTFDEMLEKLDVTMSADIIKAEESGEQRIVWGWASVSMIGKDSVVDLQNDEIEPDELVKATTEFMEEVRTAKAMHDGDQIGLVVHSLPLTEELAKSLGIETERQGWIVGLKVYDDDVWKRVKEGELKAFSIGGQALREENYEAA